MKPDEFGRISGLALIFDLPAPGSAALARKPAETGA